VEGPLYGARMSAGVAAALVLGGLEACGSVSGLETQARILTQPSCSDFFFPIYFKDRSAGIPPGAMRVVRASSRRSQGCRIAEVKVVGLPDPKAPVAPPMAIAHDRAARVAESLRAAGFPEPVFELSALGEAGAGLPEAELPRRRVDVYVRFAR
jgi:peptidoglycan-associated lipoprotein